MQKISEYQICFLIMNICFQIILFKYLTINNNLHESYKFPSFFRREIVIPLSTSFFIVF
jgi:hypothetical protein